MRSPWKIAVGTIGVLAAIWWSLRGVAFREVLRIVKDMDLIIASIVLGLTTLNLMIRATVWKYIINPLKPILVRRAASSYLIGVFSNLFLPFKLGDVAQGYAVGRREEISKLSAVSAVVIQRVFEIFSLMLIMLVVAAFSSVPFLFTRRTALLGLLLVATIAGVVMAYRMRERWAGVMERALSVLSPHLGRTIRRWLELAMAGTAAMHRVPDVVRIVSLSLLSWFVQIVMVLLTARALSISLDLVAASIVLLVINIGLTIPIAPGNIGTFQVFSIVALSMFSVDKAEALTFAVVFQVIQGVPVVILGALSLASEAMRSRQHVSVAK